MTSAMGGDAGLGLNGGSQQGQQIQQAASGLVDQAARTAEAQASTTMTKAGEALEQVASAIRQASESMRQDQPQIAGFVDTAADRVQEVSTYLRDSEAGEAVENIQQMARRQPALVVGGGLALGMLLGRLLKSGASSSQSQSRMSAYDAYGTSGYDATGYGTGYGSTGYGSTGGYDAGTTGYDAGGTGYGGTPGFAGAGSMGAGGVGVAATDTLGDTAGSSYGSEFGTGSDDLADNLSATDTMTVTSDDVLGDEGTSGVERER